MDEGYDLVDCIRDIRVLLDESIDILSELQFSTLSDTDEEITPINNMIELIDMSIDVGRSERLKQAEAGLMRRQPF